MLYCQCSRRQRERRPGSSNVPKARICGMLEDWPQCAGGVEKSAGMVNGLVCVCVTAGRYCGD